MKPEAYKVVTPGYETALFLNKLDAEEHAHKILASVSIVSQVTALYPPLKNNKGVGLQIMISIDELISNKGNWQDVIEDYIENAKSELEYEIFMNGDWHIDEYLAKKKRTENAK